VRQVVLVAAGLDTRAFRLDWPRGTRLYEIDLPEVLDAKEHVIRTSEATANCDRVTVGSDLREPGWPEALVGSGYQPARRSVWLIEGLLYYLSRAAVDGLLANVRSLMAAQSSIGLDVMNTWLFSSPSAWPMQAALAWRGAPGRFGTNDPEALLARHGFDAAVTQPGEQGANFGRWPAPMLPRDVPGVPRTFLVRARTS
jgi:methyltransferase (TIGR00027 family)